MKSIDFRRKVIVFSNQTAIIKPLTPILQAPEFSTLPFAPEHIPWLAGPVSVPGRTVRQGVSRFTSGSLTRGSGFVNGIGEVVTEA